MKCKAILPNDQIDRNCKKMANSFYKNNIGKSEIKMEGQVRQEKY